MTEQQTKTKKSNGITSIKHASFQFQGDQCQGSKKTMNAHVVSMCFSLTHAVAKLAGMYDMIIIVFTINNSKIGTAISYMCVPRCL